MIINLEELKETLETQKEKKSDNEIEIEPKTYKGDDISKLTAEEKRLRYKKYVLSSENKDFQNLIEKYVAVRYNYDNKSEKNKVPDKLNDLVSDDFKKTIKKRLSQDWISDNCGIGGGKYQHAKIVAIAFDESKQAEAPSGLRDKSKYIVNYGKSAIVKLKINDIFYAYTFVQFYSDVENYQWIITDEEIQGLYYEGE